MGKFMHHIILISTLFSTTHQASIGHRYDQNAPPLSKIFHSAVAPQQNLQPSAVFDNVDGVLNAIDTVAKFIRDYNAIPKIASCLKFIMPRFKTGRKILMYYEHVKAKHEARFQQPSKISKPGAIIVPTTAYAPVYIYPSKADLEMAKALSVMRRASGEARVPQALKRVTCYNCRTRKEQWKRYNTFQNRRKRWPKQYYNPKHIIPASNELHLLDYATVTVEVTVKPTPLITTRSFRDILPGPNQLPYYANMFLDVFDTHFETWNAKIRSAIRSIKQKWADKNKTTAKEESQSSSSSLCSGSSCCSGSKCSFSSDYDSTGSESDSRSSYTSSEYYDESDYSNRNAPRFSDERRNERFNVRNLTSRVINKARGADYEYYSYVSNERRRFRPMYKNRRYRRYFDSADFNQNFAQITRTPKTLASKVALINNKKHKFSSKKIFRGTYTSSSTNKSTVLS